MTWVVSLAVVAGAVAVVVREIRVDRRRRRWQAQRELEERMAYLARRSQKMRADLDTLGDDVLQHVFPAPRNGR